MPKDWNDGGARGRTSWDQSDRVWNRGGIQPQARQTPQPRSPVSDASAIYPHLKQEARQTARIGAKTGMALARGLIPDHKRGSVSPLGGVAQPAPKRPGMKETSDATK
jgi:hypothetical protein